MTDSPEHEAMREEAARIFAEAHDAREAGDFDAAQMGLSHAALLAPDAPEVFAALGDLARDHGRMRGAGAQYRRALALTPDDAALNLKLGRSLRGIDPNAAAVHLFRAAAAAPKDGEALLALAASLRDLGLPRESLVAIGRVLSQEPDSHEALRERCLSLLCAGDYAGGFADLARLDHRRMVPAEWTGQALEGKTILLHSDGPEAETVLLSRFAAVLTAMGGRCIIESPKSLRRLFFSGLSGVSAVVAQGDLLPSADYHCALRKLPHLLDIDAETLPDEPYIEAPNDPRFAISPAPGARLKVGLVWRQERAATGDALHAGTGGSAHLADFAPLMEIGDIALFSLQTEGPHKEIREGGFDGLIDDIGSAAVDFAGLAAAIAQMDLVIAVDSVVAHIAGAMGKPVWLAASAAADWAAAGRGDETPWHPTMTIYRQDVAGDWSAPVARMAEALAAGPGRVPRPLVGAAPVVVAPEPAPAGEGEVSVMDMEAYEPPAESGDGVDLEPADDDALAAIAGADEVPVTEMAEYEPPALEDEGVDLEPADADALDEIAGADEVSVIEMAKYEPPALEDEGVDLEPADADALAEIADAEEVSVFEMAEYEPPPLTEGGFALPDEIDAQDDELYDFGDEAPASAAAAEEQLFSEEDGDGDDGAGAVDDGLPRADDLGFDFSDDEDEGLGAAAAAEESDLGGHARIDDDHSAAMEDVLAGDDEARARPQVGDDAPPLDLHEDDAPEMSASDDPNDALDDMLAEDAPARSRPVVEDDAPPLDLHEDDAPAMPASDDPNDALDDMLAEDAPARSRPVVEDDAPPLDLHEDDAPAFDLDDDSGLNADEGSEMAAAAEAAGDFSIDELEEADDDLMRPDAGEDEALVIAHDDAPAFTSGGGGEIEEIAVEDLTPDDDAVFDLPDEKAEGYDLADDDDVAAAPTFGEDLPAPMEEDEGAFDLGDLGDDVTPAEAPPEASVEDMMLYEPTPEGGRPPDKSGPDKDPPDPFREAAPGLASDDAAGAADPAAPPPDPSPERSSETPPRLAGAPRPERAETPRDEAHLPLPSALRNARGRPRFVMPLAREDFRDPDIIQLVRHEADFGGWRRAVREFLDAHLLPGDALIDVGAHWGVFAIGAATRWPGEVMALALEPEPKNAARLERWIEANRLAAVVETMQVAVADARGEIAFRRGLGSMRHERVDEPDRTGEDGFTAPAATLDDLIEARPGFEGRRLFVKIDAGAMTAAAVAGARRLLNSGRVAAVIWPRGPWADHDPGRRALLDALALLTDAGFRHFRLPDDTLGGAMSRYVYSHDLCTIISVAADFETDPAYMRPFGAPEPRRARPHAGALDEAARREWTALLIREQATDAGRWADVNTAAAGAEGRAAAAAAMMSGLSGSLLDVGAGRMALREAAPSFDYTPLDLVARAENAHVADLNTGEWPEGRWSVAAMIATLEYLHDIPGALAALRARADALIIGYAAADGETADARRARGVFNDLTRAELRAALEQAGWSVVVEPRDEADIAFMRCK